MMTETESIMDTTQHQPSSSSSPPESITTTTSTRKTRGGKPKLFQCKGYGDCRMVFTRSEHLARHMRKHTGEKPFKCIVPECNKTFSRFDNMMQHTQTHNKGRNTTRRSKSTGSMNSNNHMKKAIHSNTTTMNNQYKSDLSRESSYEQTGLPSPPPSRRGSSMNNTNDLHSSRYSNRKRRNQQRKNYSEIDEDEDDEDDDGTFEEDHQQGDSDSDTSSNYQHKQENEPSIMNKKRMIFNESLQQNILPPLAPHPTTTFHSSWSSSSSSSYFNSHQQHQQQQQQQPIWLLPSSTTMMMDQEQQQPLPESPLSSTSSTSSIYDSASYSKRSRVTPKVQFHPYPYHQKQESISPMMNNNNEKYTLRPLYNKTNSSNNKKEESEDSEDDHQHHDQHMILPRLATYLMNHPDEPPENYFLQQHEQQHLPTRSMTWPSIHKLENTITRRLSIQDLCNPIECLEKSMYQTNLDSHYVKEDDEKEEKTESHSNLKKEEGIDLTLDEFEAIQGFGRFQKCYS